MSGHERSSLPDWNSTSTADSSRGLHNLVTGLTGQSPALSPSRKSSLISPAPSIIEQAGSSRPPPPLPLNLPTTSLFGSTLTTTSSSGSSVPAFAVDTNDTHPPRPPSPARPSSSPLSGTRWEQDDVVSEDDQPLYALTASKEVDDPSQPVDRNSHADHTGDLNDLTRLFAVTSMSPGSRQPSQDKHSATVSYTRTRTDQAAPLPHHLWTRGFLDGRHSDITVHAFGNAYTLHRILLDRAPFFSTALSEPWLESTAKEITLAPGEVDANITQTAFELALKRLYGSSVPAEEESEAVGLFAVGSWLEMTDLVESSLDNLLRRMTTADVACRIRLVTSSYYGQHGLRLLSAAKALLYREGWEMPLRHWDAIPGDIIRDVVGADGFFVPGEWQRWRLAKKLLERRLQQSAMASGLSLGKGKGKAKAIEAPKGSTVEVAAINTVDQLQAVYARPEIAPLIELLDEGIHYVHMTFEQLQRVRQERDSFGVAPVSEEALTNALWMSMELRGRVMNTAEANSQLGLSLQARRPRRSFTKRVAGAEEMKKSKSNESAESSGDNQNTSSGHAADNKVTQPVKSRTRKFWIPQVDSTKVIGDSTDHSSGRFADLGFSSALTSQAPSGGSQRRSFDPLQSQRALEGTLDPPQQPATTLNEGHDPDHQPPLYYTKYPPFRFSVEFPDPRLLKDKKRVYSHTVEYLGSHWNIYIQKIKSSKNTQLGVYLHRAKEREGEKKIRGNAGPRSVDEAIGQLEREMLLRRTERRLRRQQQYEAQLEGDEESSSGGEHSASRGGPGENLSTHPTHPSRGPRHRASTKRASQSPITGSSNAAANESHADRLGVRGSSDDEDGDDDDDDDNPAAVTTNGRSPAMPAYVDQRPTIKTYFKIYSPTKGGLSLYESAPDEFNFSQSWGWRSSMILDDGSSTFGASGNESGSRGRDGRLRYSVVLGNV